ncbi:hypothetical protein [Rufibacter hautae]|uniref:Uncharacterized protein n=1 Tax=Rufibacter hautae TaxID=2595005 RepID=A0A5B6TEJ9_9BACT|nr:hypothetical protein [Rufibacter hautae]KAA3437660.1 hypothetical protein FOA19_10155 [Rufibacter hautae]
MDLDEFKKRWGATQKEGPDQQGHTREAIDRIIKGNTYSLGELREKSAFWNRIGGWNSALMVLLAVGFLVWQYHRGMAGAALAGKLPLVAVLIGFALFSSWTYRRQEEIFTENTDASSTEALRRTLSEFRRYYRFTNTVFLIISPVAFYAMFAVFLDRLVLSLGAVVLASAALTGFSFLLRYWYYRAIYFRRIKAMEANLRELEDIPGAMETLGSHTPAK